MKTIKQIADELGVSKTAVRKRLTPEVQTKFAETIENVIYISDEGEALIKSSFSKTAPQTGFAEVSANQFAGVSSEVSALLVTLKEQLQAKDEQLAVLASQLKTKDEQISFLQQNTIAAQQLHAGTIKRQLAAASPVDTVVGVSSKHWWQFWKRNNDDYIRFPSGD